MVKFASVALALLACSAVNSDDKTERDRRAKAALALTTHGSVAVAPSPRVAVDCYASGYTRATAESLVLVVFVGCSGHSATGAISAKVDDFPDIKSPAVVISYPIGDRLFVHEVIACPVEEAKLANAIAGAKKKIAAPTKKDAASPKPLKWDL